MADEQNLSAVGNDKILPDFRAEWQKARLTQAFESAAAPQVDKSYSYAVAQADKLIAKGAIRDKKISPGKLDALLVANAARNPKSVAAALYHPAVLPEARYFLRHNCQNAGRTNGAVSENRRGQNILADDARECRGRRAF